MSCGCGVTSSCGGVSAGGLVVGVPGPRGPKGDKGDPGDGSGGVAVPGPKGDKGDPGVPGRDGVDGAPGRDGVDGSPGADGRDGVDGAPGSDGAPGRDGVDGAPGEKGDPGPSSWAAIPDVPEGVPGGFPVLDAQGLVPAGNLPDVVAESIVDSTEVGRAVVTAQDDRAARSAIGTLLAGSRSSLLGSKIRGGNITTKTYHQWDHFWSEWDWDNWVKPQVDRAVKLGFNTIRVIGGPRVIFQPSINLGYTWGPSAAFEVDYLIRNGGRVYMVTQAGTTAASGTGPSGTGASITDGTVVWKYVREDDLAPITQAVYDSRWKQLVEYCGENGLWLYPALMTAGDFDAVAFGNFRNPVVLESLKTTAAMLSNYSNVIGFDLFQEGDSYRGSAVPWAGSRAYAVGNYVTNGGNAYKCVTAGTSAASGGPTGTAASVADGTVVWEYDGVPLTAADVLAAMRDVRAVSNVPLTMSTVAFAGTSVNFWAGVQTLNYQVNADPAGADFIDLHIYEDGITPAHIGAYLEFFGKPLLVGEFGCDQTMTVQQQTARYASIEPIHARPGVLGSLVWALADQGTADPARLYGVWDNTGFVQGSSPLSVTAGARPGLAAGVRKLLPASPVLKSGGEAALVCTTKAGAAGAEDGANTWAKIATANTGTNTFTNLKLVLAVVGFGVTAHDTALVSVSFAVGASGSDPVVGVDIIAEGGGGGFIAADSFKAVSGGFGTDMELWVRKGTAFGGFKVYELSRGYGGNATVGLNMLTYSRGPAWQSAVPTGAVNNVSSRGVTSFGDTAVTATAPQTITRKTLNSPRVDRLLDTNGAPILLLDPVAGAVDYLRIANGTGGAQLRAEGTSPNIDVNVFGKGSGDIKFRNDGGIGFVVDPVAGGINFLFTRGSATGEDVTLGVAGTDPDVNVNVTPAGAGVIQQRGVQVELKGHGHVVADVMGAESTARKGVADGYASLDSNGRMPASQLPSTALSWVAAPSTSSSPGVSGQMASDGGFLYVCVAANQWRRTDLTTW